jgi:protocatechuate 3,4-dioxygenase alpha subunit
MTAPATTSQTVGPFFSIGLDWLNSDDVAGPGVPGERVEIRGRVIDGEGIGVPDCVLELWQADPNGHYENPEDGPVASKASAFRGFGRVPTLPDGSFRFTTIKPGRVPGPSDEPQAPHILVSVFCRGLMLRLVTRIYFPEEPANDRDFALGLVPPSRQRTLVARKSPNDLTLEWNVVLQGQDETVFFDV